MQWWPSGYLGTVAINGRVGNGGNKWYGPGDSVGVEMLGCSWVPTSSIYLRGPSRQRHKFKLEGLQIADRQHMYLRIKQEASKQKSLLKWGGVASFAVLLYCVMWLSGTLGVSDKGVCSSGKGAWVSDKGAKDSYNTFILFAAFLAFFLNIILPTLLLLLFLMCMNFPLILSLWLLHWFRLTCFFILFFFFQLPCCYRMKITVFIFIFIHLFVHRVLKLYCVISAIRVKLC